MRHLFYALSLWMALAPGTQGTQNNDAGQTDSIATPPPLRLADIQQCPAAPKPSCDDPNCQGARHQCATQYLCSSENPLTDPSSSSSSSCSSSPSSSGRQVILAGCRCCPLPIHVECTDTQCAAPAPAPRVCAAEPLRGCSCQTADDRFRAAQERTAGWVWPLDKNDEAYDVDIEPDSGDEDEAQVQAQPASSSSSSSAATAARGSSGSIFELGGSTTTHGHRAAPGFVITGLLWAYGGSGRLEISCPERLRSRRRSGCQVGAVQAGLILDRGSDPSSA